MGRKLLWLFTASEKGVVVHRGRVDSDGSARGLSAGSAKPPNSHHVSTGRGAGIRASAEPSGPRKGNWVGWPSKPVMQI